VRVRKDVYAHADTAVLAATASPFNRRYSVVVMAGLQAAATERAAGWFAERGNSGSEVVILRPGRAPRVLVVSE
jgi:hypothetical protein